MLVYKFQRGQISHLACFNHPCLEARSADPCSDPASRIFAGLHTVTAYKVRHLNVRGTRMIMYCPLLNLLPLDMKFMSHLQILRISLKSI